MKDGGILFQKDLDVLFSDRYTYAGCQNWEKMAGNVLIRSWVNLDIIYRCNLVVGSFYNRLVRQYRIISRVET